MNLVQRVPIHQEPAVVHLNSCPVIFIPLINKTMGMSDQGYVIDMVSLGCKKSLNRLFHDNFGTR